MADRKDVGTCEAPDPKPVVVPVFAFLLVFGEVLLLTLPAAVIAGVTAPARQSAPLDAAGIAGKPTWVVHLDAFSPFSPFSNFSNFSNFPGFPGFSGFSSFPNFPNFPGFSDFPRFRKEFLRFPFFNTTVRHDFGKKRKWMEKKDLKNRKKLFVLFVLFCFVVCDAHEMERRRRRSRCGVIEGKREEGKERGIEGEREVGDKDNG